MKAIITASLISSFLFCCHPTKPIQTDYQIRVGQKFKIKMPENGTTGYRWHWINQNRVKVVDTSRVFYIPNEPIRIGSGGTIVWEFIGKEPGLDSLVLVLQRGRITNKTDKIKKVSVQVKR
jgi:predicted secreted protein